MVKFASIGRWFVAIGMIAFGIQHLAYQEFVTRVAPHLPAWIPAQAFFATVVGLVLIAAGAAIAFQIKARIAATALGGMILAFALLSHLTAALAEPHNGGLWTNVGKGLALAGSAWIVLGALRVEANAGKVQGIAEDRCSSRLVSAGKVFFAGFLILCGIQHFIYPQFVAMLIPEWIPSHVFWTYFSAIALIAGGVGILLPFVSRTASLLTATMVFLWVLMLHVPRALANLQNSNETTAVFEALALCGTACMLTAISKAERTRALAV